MFCWDQAGKITGKTVFALRLFCVQECEGEIFIEFPSFIAVRSNLIGQHYVSHDNYMLTDLRKGTLSRINNSCL